MNRVTLWAFMMVFIMICIINALSTEMFKEVLVYKVEQNTMTFDIVDQVGTDTSFLRYVPSMKVVNNQGQAWIKPTYDVGKDEYVITALPSKVYVVILSKAMGVKKLGDIKDIYIQEYTKQKYDILQAIFSSMPQTKSFTLSTSQKDVVVICDTPRKIKAFLQTSPEYKILDYEEIDLNILKTISTIAATEDVDCNREFGLRERFPVFRLVYFDLMLATKFHNVKGFERDLYTLVTLPQLRDQFEKNNYYTKFFNFLPLTLTYLRKMNRHITSRDALPILEQFTNTYTSKRNVDGYLEGDVFVTRHHRIDGVPVETKDMVIQLRNQRRDHENGDYTFINTDGKRYYLRKISSVKRMEGVSRCYTDPSKSSKEECLRVPGNVWDRPCITNEECPFYQANKRYNNYRGGCNDGFCEYPIGIKGVSYRTYDPQSKAVCHGCPVEQPACCESQGKNPDYAFELDIYERSQTNMSI